MGDDQENKMTDVAVVVLTYNEEANIAQSLTSMIGWARQVFILDSHSTDRTLEIASAYSCTIVQNRFVNYARQRNFALEQLPIQTEWVFFLDADEWLPDDLKREICEVLTRNPEENGFYLKRRLIWMGKWIRHGYYPTWILRLFRHGHARCEDRAVNEHIIVNGKTGYLRQDFMHEDHKGVGDWIEKHNRYASQEALELLKLAEHCDQEIKARFWGSQAQRKRWLRKCIWNRLPHLIRPIFYYFYRYILRGGFLDGRAAFIYHFLQGLWFPMLIDVKYIENKQRRIP